MVLFYGMFLTTRTKMGKIRQSYNGIDAINVRADAKRFTQKKQDDANNNTISVIFNTLFIQLFIVQVKLA